MCEHFFKVTKNDLTILCTLRSIMSTVIPSLILFNYLSVEQNVGGHVLFFVSNKKHYTAE